MNSNNDSLPGITFTGPITVNGPMFDIHDNGHVEIHVKGPLEAQHKDDTGEIPSREAMIAAVLATAQQGYWWSSRSWAVVYRVYQMKGYMANVSQFVREVREWKVKTGYECSYDAVQKPLASGIFVGNPDKWEAQGAQGQAAKLAEALLKELAN